MPRASRRLDSPGSAEVFMLALALPWSAIVGERGSGTGCLISLATSRLSKRLRPQHPPAAMRKAIVIDRHAAPQSSQEESSRAPRADERFARRTVARR